MEENILYLELVIQVFQLIRNVQFFWKCWANTNTYSILQEKSNWKFYTKIVNTINNTIIHFTCIFVCISINNKPYGIVWIIKKKKRTESYCSWCLYLRLRNTDFSGWLVGYWLVTTCVDFKRRFLNETYKRVRKYW